MPLSTSSSTTACKSKLPCITVENLPILTANDWRQQPLRGEHQASRIIWMRPKCVVIRYSSRHTPEAMRGRGRNRTGGSRESTLACLAGEKKDIANPHSDKLSSGTVKAAAFLRPEAPAWAFQNLSPHVPMSVRQSW